MTILRFAGAFLMIAVLYQCSSTNQVPTSETTEEEQIPRQVKKTTPCVILDELTGYQREEVQTAFTLYRDQIKFNDPKAAYPLWSKAFHGAPGGNGRITYHYDDGITIFKALFADEENATKKASYVDSIDMVYSKRAECFGKADYLAGRKAFDYYYTFSEYVEEEKIWNLFLQNLNNKGDTADYFIVNPMTAMLFDRIVQEKIDHTEGQILAKKLMSVIKHGQENCKGKLCDSWEIISEYAPVRLEALEGIDGFYDCDYYSSKYYPLLQSSPDDCETIELVYRRLLRGECNESSAELTEVAAAKEEKCYTPPPPPGPLKQAFNAYNSGDYREAVTLFENFVDLTDDVEKKAKYLLLIAKIYYRDLKNYPASRQYAIQAAELKDNWGEPYMLIGKLYASSGPLCGPGRGWDSQIVTWPAIDKFEYARSIDPEVATEASQFIRQYRQYMPKKEDIFFRQLNAGDSYRVGCWIQESTRIRTAD